MRKKCLRLAGLGFDPRELELRELEAWIAAAEELAAEVGVSGR